MTQPRIWRVSGREILDSRGNPTVEATVILEDGTVGLCSVPSGASTGIYEAHEKRDGDPARFGGKGVCDAVRGIPGEISPALSGLCASEQCEIDALLRELDGTREKERLGANAILAVSLAVARAAANYYHQPLYRYLGGVGATRLPVPMMNILNGGAHAANNMEIQECMIVPVGAPSFREALRWGSEIHHALGRILQKERLATGVGDEGGFAPDLPSDEAALELIVRAIYDAGYDTDRVRLAIDAAAGEWYEDGNRYRQPKRGKSFSREEMISYWQELAERFPLISIEDGLDQRDFEGWADMTARLGRRLTLVGDDFFVTHAERLRKGIAKGAGNAILVKPNQVGTLTETLDVVRLARDAGYRFILSHRSGETEDTTLADIAVATGAAYIKAGAPCRSERVAKYNRLLRIESAIGRGAVFGNGPAREAFDARPADRPV